MWKIFRFLGSLNVILSWSIERNACQQEKTHKLRVTCRKFEYRNRSIFRRLEYRQLSARTIDHRRAYQSYWKTIGFLLTNWSEIRQNRKILNFSIEGSTINNSVKSNSFIISVLSIAIFNAPLVSLHRCWTAEIWLVRSIVQILPRFWIQNSTFLSFSLLLRCRESESFSLHMSNQSIILWFIFILIGQHQQNLYRKERTFNVDLTSS